MHFWETQTKDNQVTRTYFHVHKKRNLWRPLLFHLFVLIKFFGIFGTPLWKLATFAYPLGRIDDVFFFAKLKERTTKSQEHIFMFTRNNFFWMPLLSHYPSTIKSFATFGMHWCLKIGTVSYQFGIVHWFGVRIFLSWQQFDITGATSRANQSVVTSIPFTSSYSKILLVVQIKIQLGGRGGTVG